MQISSNFFKGKEYKDLMSGLPLLPRANFEQMMKHIKSMDKAAYDWLMRESPRNWARCMFNPREKYNRMDNNISEGFNSSVKYARDKPILIVMEIIRRKGMSRYQDMIMFIQGFKCNICPRIKAKLYKARNEVGG